jgi:adenylosuccinate synthase
VITTKVVVGGQFGSEAKAKAAIYLSKSSTTPDGWRRNIAGVRCGGPNAGHTVWVDDKKYVLRMVPSLVVNPYASLYIAAGAMVDVNLLLKEIDDLEDMGLQVKRRLEIDPETAVVDKSAIEMEKSIGLGDNIGSTQTGTGGAASLRCLRKTVPVSQSHKLNQYVKDSVWKSLVRTEKEVIIEGTQGYGLSLYHAGYYPYCTSKPATAAQFVAEAGVPMKSVSMVMAAIRTYPIRVGGNSGPLDREISWAEVAKRSGHPNDLVEMTSVTKKIRRVAEFDTSLVRDAIEINGVTHLAVHGMDYICYDNYGVRKYDQLTTSAKEWLDRMETELGVPIAVAFTGPHQDDVVQINGQRT